MRFLRSSRLLNPNLGEEYDDDAGEEDGDDEEPEETVRPEISSWPSSNAC